MSLFNEDKPMKKNNMIEMYTIIDLKAKGEECPAALSAEPKKASEVTPFKNTETKMEPEAEHIKTGEKKFPGPAYN
jgi:hypothetical protein